MQINRKDILNILCVLLFSVIFFIIGYSLSGDRAKPHSSRQDIPSECIATHNYCTTMRAEAYEAKKDHLKCLNKLKEALDKKKEKNVSN